MTHPVTIVQEKSIWSTSCDGVDFMQCVILMTLYTDGFLCCPDDQEEAAMSGVPVLAGEGPQAKVPPPPGGCVCKGGKLMLPPISSSYYDSDCDWCT